MIKLIETNPKYVELWHAWRAEPNTLKYNPIAVTSLEKLKERMALMSSDLSNLKGAEEFQFFILIIVLKFPLLLLLWQNLNARMITSQSKMLNFLINHLMSLKHIITITMRE